VAKFPHSDGRYLFWARRGDERLRELLAQLQEAAGKLDDGQPFKNLSTSDDQPSTVESVSSTQ